jgi:hypothetical protein
MRLLVWKIGSCAFVWSDAGPGAGVTFFPDGRMLAACPQDTDQYRQTTRDLGYPDDAAGRAQMCREHEQLHSLQAAQEGKRFSDTLYYEACAQAGGDLIGLATLEQRVEEEARILAWQRKVNDPAETGEEVEALRRFLRSSPTAEG